MVKTKKKTKKVYFNKTFKKHKIGGSGDIINNHAIYVPLSLVEGGYQVMSNTIGKNHFEGFLDSLIQSIIFQRKIMNDFNIIQLFVKKNDFMKYYKPTILEDIKTKDIKNKILLLTKIKIFLDKSEPSSNIFSNNSLNSTTISAISVMNGGSEYFQSISGVVILLGALIWYFKDDCYQIKEIISNTRKTMKTSASMVSEENDNFNANKYMPEKSIYPQPDVTKPAYKNINKKRSVLGVIFSDGQRCMLKISRNSNFIGRYKIETKVYDKLKYMTKSGVLPIDIIDYYGSSGEKLIPINKNPRYLLIDIKIGKKSYKTNIRVSDFGKYFYFAMEWDSDYKILQEALDGISAKKRNKAIECVCDSLGRLNYEYGFYHGDMKIDNVMINIEDFSVKNFDFDFSGLLSVVQNNTMVDAWFDTKREKVRNYINTSTRSGKFSEAKNFLFFFDIYRLWCSLPTSFGRTGRYDTHSSTNKIEVSNGSIRFKFKDFVDFFKSNGNGHKELVYLNQKKINNRSLDILMLNIGKKIGLSEKYLLDWNRTLMNEIIVFHLFDYIRNLE